MTTSGYDVAVCADHLRGDDSGNCMTLSCAARRACPVGRDYMYDPAQSRFHMVAFLSARPPGHNKGDSIFN
jgi:hypothetical protein